MERCNGNINQTLSDPEYTRVLKWGEVKSLSHVWLFATPWTIAYHAPPSMGFSGQEYWSGLPFPSAQKYAMGLHMSSNKYPVGETAVPSSDPGWNCNNLGHIGKETIFLICVKAGLKAAESNQLHLSLSSNSAAQWKPHGLCGKAKRGSRYVYQLGTDDFKDQISVPKCIRYKNKVTEVGEKTALRLGENNSKRSNRQKD